MPEKFGGRRVWEDPDERTRIFYVNLAVIWIWSKIVSRRIFHSQVIKVKLGVSRSLRVTWRIPFGGTCDHRAREVVVSSHPASLTFSVVCLSLLPQHGARYFPTYHLLSRDSGPSGHTKLNRNFRNCLTHSRICTQVCQFLEMISEMRFAAFWDLTFSGGLAAPTSLCVTPIPLCTPASPPFLSASLCLSLLPSPMLFSPDWLALSLRHCAL